MTDFTYTDATAATGGTGESAMSLGWSDLKSEVGFFLKYGRDTWTATQETEIEAIVHSGVRRAYYPPAMGEGKERTAGYEWSWLRPSATLSLVAKYNTGTITVVAGVVTLTVAGTFPSWAAAGDLTVDGIQYSVNTRDGDNQVTLDDTSVTAAALSTYSLARSTYDLPDDYGRISGDFSYAPQEYLSGVRQVAVSEILAMRSASAQVGDPQFFATRFKSATPAAVGSRQEVLFFPEPDVAQTLYYEYEAYSGKLTDALPYPLGGMQMAEVYVESCLALAESRIEDAHGVHVAEFSALMLDAIARDKKKGAKIFGQMGHKSDNGETPEFRRGMVGGTYPITYGGEYI